MTDPVFEALKARGIAAYRGNSRPMPFATQEQTAPAVNNIAGAVDASMSGGMSGVAPSVMPPTAVPPTSNVSNNIAAAVDPSTSADGDWLTALDLGSLAVGAGTVAGTQGYKLYNSLKSKKQGINSSSFGANTGSAPKPGQMGNSSSTKPSYVNSTRAKKSLAGPSDIIDAEWTEVPDTKQLPYDDSALKSHMRNRTAVKQLGNDPTRMNDFMKSRTGVKALPAPVPGPPVITEAPDAGLSRMLGLPSGALKQLRQNKGLARTLGRVIK